MPTDMNDVAISFGGDHTGDRALVFKHRIGRDRRAVIKMGNA